VLARLQVAPKKTAELRQNGAAVTFKRMNSRSLANGAVVLEVTVDVRRWDEKAGLRQDAISSQVIDALESARDKGDRQ